MKPPHKSVAPIPKHHPIANSLRTSGPRSIATRGLSMEFMSGKNPKNSTTKPVPSRLLRARAKRRWDSSGSFCMPQAYRAYLACATSPPSFQPSVSSERQPSFFLPPRSEVFASWELRAQLHSPSPLSHPSVAGHDVSSHLGVLQSLCLICRAPESRV